MRKLSASKPRNKTKRSPVREDSFGLDIGLESLNQKRPEKIYKSKSPIDEEEDCEEYPSTINNVTHHKKNNSASNSENKPKGAKVKPKNKRINGGDNYKPRGEPKQPAFVEKHKNTDKPTSKPNGNQRVLLTILIIIGIMFIVGGYIGYSMSQNKSKGVNKTTSEYKQNAQDDREITNATKHVAIAEGSLLEEDYLRALKLVQNLANGNEKESLLDRLDTVKSQINASDASEKEEEERQKEIEKEAETKAKEKEEEEEEKRRAQELEQEQQQEQTQTQTQQPQQEQTKTQQSNPSNGTANSNSGTSNSTQQKTAPKTTGKVLIIDERGNIYYK